MRRSGTLILEHGDALDAHAEGETGKDLGIDAAVAQHIGMDHAAAQDLQPAGPLADRILHSASLPEQRKQLMSTSADGSVN